MTELSLSSLRWKWTGPVKRTELTTNEPVVFSSLSVHFSVHFAVSVRFQFTLYSGKENAKRIENFSSLGIFLSVRPTELFLCRPTPKFGKMAEFRLFGRNSAIFGRNWLYFWPKFGKMAISAESCRPTLVSVVRYPKSVSSIIQ